MELELYEFLQSREKMMKGVRRGCVRLRSAIIGIDDQDVNTFTITVDHKTFHFQVSSVNLHKKEMQIEQFYIHKYHLG